MIASRRMLREEKELSTATIINGIPKRVIAVPSVPGKRKEISRNIVQIAQIVGKTGLINARSTEKVIPEANQQVGLFVNRGAGPMKDPVVDPVGDPVIDPVTNPAVLGVNRSNRAALASKGIIPINPIGIERKTIKWPRGLVPGHATHLLSAFSWSHWEFLPHRYISRAGFY